jgi:hypothetical protein
LNDLAQWHLDGDGVVLLEHRGLQLDVFPHASVSAVRLARGLGNRLLIVR